MNQRMTVFFTGHVQGVGFRYGAQQLATGFEVVGTVENHPDGRVLLVVEGTGPELQEFLQAIEDSHLRAHIRQKEVAWSEASGGLSGFKIKR
jgi:acylphosphatase